jgi:hypothetical protein
VIDALRAVGIRSDEAYPGRRIPALTGPVAAVKLGKVDRSVRTTTVLVTVMSPAKAGGSTCETTALGAVEVLQEMGATCVKEICRFDEMADVFYIEIEARFFGTALKTGWSPGPGYTVKIGSQTLDHVVSFSAERSVSEDAPSIADAQWRFVMEELLPPGVTEPPAPVEPFQVTVIRPGSEESFANCTWTSARREQTIRGVTQIRKGVAGKRDDMGIL